MSTIAIIDYGMGNLHSIGKALEHVAEKHRIIITNEHQALKQADKIVFPGVGAIRDCMHELKKQSLNELIIQLSQEKPFLGICLGMHALMDNSDENDGIQCLAIFKGHVKKFTDGLIDENTQEKLKIPHMGWNQVHHQNNHVLWNDIKQDSRFYFVHSYYVTLDNSTDECATTNYPTAFSSVIARDNLFAVQFHPEKSQHDGLQLLQNFTNWTI
ncbi:MAG: imidazole glycerol phosphate synthase subunit HisH [Methylococcales bacterium]|jgi:imidazole glycerol-phosphate synthase subunit HisH|nr:imidazole glycerol phosphate synthase subunit HisH [Methylococcales bacterium]